MLTKILGLGDLVTGLMIPLYAVFPHMFLIVGAKYLIIKGGFFAFGGDMASFLDVICGVYLVLLFFGLSYWVFTTIAFVWLMQKAVFSLLM